ncbi:hypothetical protein HK098_002758 [Nowakowskiella sp. JEL0407]|nr:hypothetical protein HK098_002758 [Nowakowskiella sp. JEL0407]
MNFGRENRIIFMGVLTAIYFIIELVIGYTFNSLALIADSFHMLSDVLGLIIGYVAFRLARSGKTTSSLTYGLQRAEVLGALLNGVFLLALCFTIILEAIQRFAAVEVVENPKALLIVGCIGLGINLIGLLLFKDEGGHAHGHSHSHSHSHDHSHETIPTSDKVDKSEQLKTPDRKLSTTSLDPSEQALTVPKVTRSRIIDAARELESPSVSRAPSIKLSVRSHSHDMVPEEEKKHSHSHSHGHGHSHGSMNMRGIFLHVLGDALGSVGVIISALTVWFASGTWKYYMDPICSVVLTIIIVTSTVPLVKGASLIFLQAVPDSVNIERLRRAILVLEDVVEVHELHVWQLSDSKTIGSVHIMTAQKSITESTSKSSNEIRKDVYMGLVEEVKEVFHSFGIHSTTVQLEYLQEEQGTGCMILCKDDDCKENTCCPPTFEIIEKKDALEKGETILEIDTRQ